MSFIDHLEDLRWHVIRSVIAIIIGAIVVFIFIREIVNNIIFAPTRADFISAQWLCKIGHKIGIGETLCFPEVNAKFLETQMTGQFVSSFTLAFIGGFIVAFPYVFWEFWKFVKPALSEKETKKKQAVLFFGCRYFFLPVFCLAILSSPHSWSIFISTIS